MISMSLFTPLKQLSHDFSFSAFMAGFITMMIGLTSSIVVLIQAAQTFGASTANINSWLWSICISIGLLNIVLSLYHKIPVVIAWSTPGAALLMTISTPISLSEATCAFICSGALTAIIGFSGLFERLVKHIPATLASAMLAGILLQFGLHLFQAMPTNPVLVLSMLAIYIVGKCLFPRLAIPLVLLAGMIISVLNHSLTLPHLQLTLAQPVWVSPSWSLASVISIALPLFIVTMASQNIPGIAIARASGFQPAVSSTIGWTGLITALFAPLGVYAINYGAISAAPCMSEEAHPDKSKRYVAAISAGVLNVLVGLFGATVAAIFIAFPKALMAAIAGIALLGIIGTSLSHAMHDSKHREAALITFICSASGISFFGIGAAFWGLLAGIVTNLLTHLAHRRH